MNDALYDAHDAAIRNAKRDMVQPWLGEQVTRLERCIEARMDYVDGRGETHDPEVVNDLSWRAARAAERCPLCRRRG